MAGSNGEEEEGSAVQNENKLLIAAFMARFTAEMNQQCNAFRNDVERFLKERQRREQRSTKEGREHPQRTIEQQRKVRDPGDYGFYHHVEPRSAGTVKHLQEQLRRQKLYEKVEKQVLESFNSVEARQKKNPATRHSTEATKEKPSCTKEPSQIVKHLPLLMKSLEAKCDISSTQFDCVPKKLTQLEPVQPSSIVSIPQVIQEESQEESLVETERNLCEVDSELAHEVQSCEKEERPEAHISLGCPVFKPREPPDLASRGIMITTESTQHLLLGAKISETHNLIHYCQTILAGHSFKLYVFNLSTSSIMHLSCPMSAQKDAGTLEKHQSLGVGDALDTLAIKRKPPDLQELQPNQKESKQGAMSELKDVTRANDVLVYHQERKLTSYFQFKDEPPDAAFKPQLSQNKFRGKGDQDKNVQEYLLPHFVLSICVNEEPPDLEVPLSKFFVKTRIGVVLTQDKKTTDYFGMIFEIDGCRASLKRPKRTTKREEDKRFKPPDLDQDLHPCINSFIMIKEAPPDATYKPKPNPNRSQGKCHMSSSFNDTDLVSFLAGKTDLRTNPFQVGEDDVIMASLEPEDNEQLEPEKNGTMEQLVAEEDDRTKEQLVPEETQDKENEALCIPLGPMTRAKAKEFLQAFYSLLHQVQGYLKYAGSTTLVIVHAT